MDKQEFLDTLRETLKGEIPPFEIEKHIKYYEEYLSENIDWKTENEKIEEIGDPRLIARTIIDTSENKNRTKGIQNNNTLFEDKKEDGTEEEFNTSNHWFLSWDTITWYQKILLGIIGVLIFVVAIGLIWLGLNIFISIILPVLIIGAIIKLAIYLWKKQ